MSNRTRTYLLIEERLGRPLAKYVTAARRLDSNGKRRSWNAIARDIHEKTKVAVTSETLRIWFAHLEDDASEPAETAGVA